jgi:penicillin-binding protein 1A
MLFVTRSDRQRRRRQKRKHPVKRVLLLGSVVLASALALGALGLVGYVLAVADDAPNLDQYHSRVPGQYTQVFAGNGQQLGYLSSDVLRKQLTREQQPNLLREATVAIEDRRFWSHGGVDYEGLVRAAFKDLFEGDGIQGGSTLTMQLVKNIYLPTNIRRNLKYKIIQAKLANELESRYGKNWILTSYLNDVPYGTVDSQSAIGVGAASKMFFDKPVQGLDLAQIALLAGLPQAPTSYNPFNNPSAARARRSEVLAAMLQAGYITQAQESRANASSLQVVANSSLDEYQQPYVMNYVQQQLVADLGQGTVDKGGLKVYTTINLADQAAAKTAIAAHEDEPGDPAAALVSINPANGNILALQNSTKYGEGPGETEDDYAVQAARQTGSSFKPFVLMTLIHDDNGNPNDTYYNSEPLAAGWLPGYPTYAVANASESDAQGLISVTKATTLSVNAVYAQLGVDLGMTNVSAMAHAMGITAPLDSNPSEAIGGLRIGVSPLQMADAYATMANGGDHVAPTIISKVVLPNGKTRYFGDPTHTNVFSQGQAYAATQVLKTVVQYGTGTEANYGCPAAGKTGTTNNYTDAWFVGYTPKLSTAVWVGYPNADTYMNDVNGLGPGYGGTLAAPIWHDFMQKASDGYCGDFATPDQYWYGTPYFGKHTALVPVYTPPATTTTTTGTNTSTTGTNGGNAVTTTASTTANTTTTAAPPPVTTAPTFSTPPAANGGNGA